MNIKGFCRFVLFPVILVLTLTIACYYILHLFIEPACNFGALAYQSSIYVVIIGMLIWLLGLSKEEKQQIITLVRNRLNK